MITKLYSEIIKYYFKILNLQATGDKFGITRERVRQILMKFSKDKYQLSIQMRRKNILREQADKSFARKHKCTICGNIEISIFWRKKRYCNKCKQLYLVEQRDPKLEFNCENCGKLFHPFLNWKTISPNHHYCSHDCYLKSNVINLKPTRISKYASKEYVKTKTLRQSKLEKELDELIERLSQ